MEILFGQKIFHLHDIYDGYEDVPGMVVQVQLHTWSFPTPEGEARLRMAIHLGHPQTGQHPSAYAFMRVTSKRILDWQSNTPLGMAMLDGLMTHEAVRRTLTTIGQEVLTLPTKEEDDSTPFKKFTIRLKESGS